MYKVQIRRNWKDPPDWYTLATLTDKEHAERELDRLTKSGLEVRLVNDAEDLKGDDKK